MDYLAKQRRVDFSTCYASTMERRFAVRLQTLGPPDHASYHSFLQRHLGEAGGLIDAFFINVKHFFKNPLNFDVLSSLILHDLIDTDKNSTLCIWRTGCARDAEAYLIATFFEEKSCISINTL